MSDGDEIIITGTTNYNGTFTISGVITGTSFIITAVWVTNNATGIWQESENLCSGTLSGSLIPLHYWYNEINDVVLDSSVLLKAGTQYAIVVGVYEEPYHCISEYVCGPYCLWFFGPGYAGGNLKGTNSTGLIVDYAYDMWFEEYGTPVTPTPANGQTNVPVDLDKLEWDDNPPMPPYTVTFDGVVWPNITETYWNIPSGTLEYDTEYTWSVDGNEWTFHTIPFYIPEDKTTTKQLVAAASNKIWYEDA